MHCSEFAKFANRLIEFKTDRRELLRLGIVGSGALAFFVYDKAHSNPPSINPAPIQEKQKPKEYPTPSIRTA